MNDRELLEAATPFFHFCRWAPWADPVQTYNGGHKQQWSVCVVCNKARFRTLWWDKQTAIGSVVASAVQSRLLVAVALDAPTTATQKGDGE